MDDLELRLMTGIDIPYPKLQISIRQPLVREVAYMGESSFFSALSVLCLTKKKFEENPQIAATPLFELVMTAITETKDVEKKNNIINLMTLLFPDYKIMFTKNSIILNKPEEKFIAVIDANNFEEIQKLFKLILGVKEKDENGGYNPASPLAQKIVDKLMKGREKIAAQKPNAEGSSLSRYISVLTVGLHFTPEAISNMTLYQFYNIVERFYTKISWDLSFQVRLAGEKPKDESKDWLS